MQWYLAPWRRYATFSGRASRREYWTFTLINFAITLILEVLDSVLGFQMTDEHIGVLTLLFGLASIIPGLAVFVRRMHDINRSGWWWLIGLIPLVGAIILLVFALTGSDGPNQYGEAPYDPDLR